MKTRTPTNPEAKDALKQTVEALLEAQKQIEAMSIDRRMALGAELASALLQASMLQRFELRTSRERDWTIETYSIVLRVGSACRYDDDIPF